MGYSVKIEYDVTRVWTEGTWLPDRARVKATSAQKLQSFTLVKSFPRKLTERRA